MLKIKMMLNQKQVFTVLHNYRKCIDILYFRHLHLSYTLYPRKPSVRKVNGSVEASAQLTDSFDDHKMQINTNKNFYGIESDEGVIIAGELSHVDELATDLYKSNPKPEKEFKVTSFGAFRLDVENKPSYVPIGFKKQKNKSIKFDTEEIVKKTLLENKIPSISGKDNSRQFQYYNTEKKIKDPETFPYSGTSENISVYSNNLKKSSDTKEYADKNSFENNKDYSYIDNLYFPLESSHQCINSSVVKQKKHESNSESVTKQSQNHTISESFLDSYYFPSEHDSIKTTSNDNAYESNCRNVKHFKENKLDSNNQHKINNSVEQPQALSDSENNKFSIKNSPITEPTSESTVSYIDEYYFPEQIIKHSNEGNDNKLNSYIEEQYFNEFETTENINSNDIKKNSMDNTKLNIIESRNMDKIDNVEKNIPNTVDTRLLSEIKSPVHSIGNINDHDTHKESSRKFQKNKFAFTTNSVLNHQNHKLKNFPKSEILHHNKNMEIGNKSAELADTNLEKFNSSENQPEMAYDFVKTLREKKYMTEEVKKGISAKKEKKLDSKGFRILKHQVPSLKYFTRDEILDLLKESILHIDDDIVILNKPYNLVIHESSTTGDSACLSMYLADMAKILDPSNKSPELITVHRLDKETTGCLLLARNNVAAQRLKSLFVQRKVMKTYWIVTIKVPDPMEGVIDMPISEGTVENKSRMVLHPNLPSDVPYKSHSKSGKRALTYYKVIATSGNAALVEVKPETGIKHQIRVHFGLGLSCPILGDHKYSYLDKLVPQKLSSDLLQMLCVRQSKVRHIPQHIHSKHILIPHYSDGRNLFVNAPLPKHMSENLRSLKFRKKK